MSSIPSRLPLSQRLSQRVVVRDASQGVGSLHGVIVEVLFLRLVQGDVQPAQEHLAYRSMSGMLPGSGCPDVVALDLAAGADVLHSTSWRHEPGSGVVVTYLALPDPCADLPASPLLQPSVVSSGDPLRPQPELLHLHHVAAHAVRHLVELASRDPAVRAIAARPGQEDLWRVMQATSLQTPTGTHAAAHAQAGQAAQRLPEKISRPPQS